MQSSLCVRIRTIAQVCRVISSQLRHVSTIGKKLVKQQLLNLSGTSYVVLMIDVKMSMRVQVGCICRISYHDHPNSFHWLSRHLSSKQLTDYVVTVGS